MWVFTSDLVHVVTVLPHNDEIYFITEIVFTLNHLSLPLFIYILLVYVDIIIIMTIIL